MKNFLEDEDKKIQPHNWQTSANPKSVLSNVILHLFSWIPWVRCGRCLGTAHEFLFHGLIQLPLLVCGFSIHSSHRYFLHMLIIHWVENFFLVVFKLLCIISVKFLNYLYWKRWWICQHPDDPYQSWRFGSLSYSLLPRPLSQPGQFCLLVLKWNLFSTLTHFCCPSQNVL